MRGFGDRARNEALARRAGPGSRARWRRFRPPEAAESKWAPACVRPCDRAPQRSRARPKVGDPEPTSGERESRKFRRPTFTARRGAKSSGGTAVTTHDLASPRAHRARAPRDRPSDVAAHASFNAPGTSFWRSFGIRVRKRRKLAGSFATDMVCNAAGSAFARAMGEGALRRQIPPLPLGRPRATWSREDGLGPANVHSSFEAEANRL